MKSFDVQELLETAKRSTELSDFGPADFLEGMNAFIGSVNAQGEIADRLWTHMYERLQRLLVNRLWFAKDVAAHPEITNENVDTPAIIVSLPRTGSTKLHRMLGAADDFQTVKLWQVHLPSRIPGLEDGGRAKRIQQTREYEKWLYETSPETITGHPVFTDEPEEDQLLNEFTFRTTYLGGAFNVPAYSQWLMQADSNPTYDYFLGQIKYFQWQNRLTTAKPWLLKTPNHLGNERHMTRIFKNPRFILTHRDPVTSMASVANLVRNSRKMYSDVDSSAGIGPMLIQVFGYLAMEHIKWRDSHPEIPILDLSFREITQDGPSAARKVYDFLGLPLPTASLRAMREWETNNERDKHGKNVYSSQVSGAGDSEIRTAFAPYIARYKQFL